MADRRPDAPGRNRHSRDPARTRARSQVLGLTALTLFFSACTLGKPIVSSGPSPRAEDCMLLHQATPTEYVCDGMIYTAVQLAQIREGSGATH
ncbi:MAG: hypothetical protein ACREQD_08120 [Candidatus Binataceae bacterium]